MIYFSGEPPSRLKVEWLQQHLLPSFNHFIAPYISVLLTCFSFTVAPRLYSVVPPERMF